MIWSHEIKYIITVVDTWIIKYKTYILHTYSFYWTFIGIKYTALEIIPSVVCQENSTRFGHCSDSGLYGNANLIWTIIKVVTSICVTIPIFRNFPSVHLLILNWYNKQITKSYTHNININNYWNCYHVVQDTFTILSIVF